MRVLPHTGHLHCCKPLELRIRSHACELPATAASKGELALFGWIGQREHAEKASTRRDVCRQAFKNHPLRAVHTLHPLRLKTQYLRPSPRICPRGKASSLAAPRRRRTASHQECSCSRSIDRARPGGKGWKKRGCGEGKWSEKEGSAERGKETGPAERFGATTNTNSS